jgi:hypothetical protein
MSSPSVVKVDELGGEGLIKELVKLLLNDNARPTVFNPGGRRTALRLGCLNEAPKEYTVVIIDIGEAKSD